MHKKSDRIKGVLRDIHIKSSLLFQVKFCKRNPGFMDSVRLGAVRAIDEWQFQFRQRRWNCSSLQDNVNSHLDLIKAHLGPKMTGSDLAGLQLSGLPALPSSSLYSQGAMGMYGDAEPTINAMFNSYNFKDSGKRVSRNSRKSRNVRGRRQRDRDRERQRRSRKG